MNFKYDEKEYDSEKLSDKGKMYLSKIQNIQVSKDKLSLDYADCEILQKHYSSLLKDELPKEEVKKDKKSKN